MCFVDFVGQMCVCVSRPMEIDAFLRKKTLTSKLVVDFIREQDTFRKNTGNCLGFHRRELQQQQRQTLEIVEDFACEAKTLRNLGRLAFFEFLIMYFFMFFIFSIFLHFSFFHFSSCFFIVLFFSVLLFFSFFPVLFRFFFCILLLPFFSCLFFLLFFSPSFFSRPSRRQNHLKKSWNSSCCEKNDFLL